MSDDPKPLSLRHARFVAEYLRDLNATQAYIRAGYAARTAQVNASKLLRHPQVQAAIAEGHKQITRAAHVDVEQIAAEYARMAMANVDDFITIDADGRVRIDLAKADRAKRASLVEISVTDYGEGRPQRVTFKLGKLQALAALTQHAEILAVKHEPGLTPEDRQRLEAQNAALVETHRRMNEERWKLQEELHEARAALAKPKGMAVTFIDNPNPPMTPIEREPVEPSPPPEEMKGIPARDTPEFRELLGKLRRGTLDYAMSMRMITAGYGDQNGPEREGPDMTYQMQCDYEPDWGGDGGADLE